MKRYIFFFALALSGFLTNHADAKEKIVLSTLHYPPYIIQGEGGQPPTGFDVEVVREVFKRMNMDFELEILPWKRALQHARNGATDGVLSCSPRDAFLVSEPISTATDALFLRNDADLSEYQITHISDLPKYPELKIGGINGYKQLQLLDELNIPYDSSSDDDIALKKLFAGRIDVLLTIMEFGKYRLKQLELPDLVIDIPIRQKEYHVCFALNRKGVKALNARFNKTLNEVRADGTYDAIHARYK